MSKYAKNVDTRESVLEAVTKSGGVLEYTSAELRADREIVLAAVCLVVAALLFFALGFASRWLA